MDRIQEKIDHSYVQHIWKAKQNIKQLVSPTPFLPSAVLSERLNSDVYLKLENYQEIGAFKVRGAANKIIGLSTDEKQRGVATFSTGNHGLAVAFIARKLGIKAVVCISHRVPKVKVEAIRRAGAQIELIGESQDEAEKHCYSLQEKHGMTVIKPFDDLDVIAGQGTIGIEIMEALPELDTIIIPLSGGGLLAGVALALKSINPSVQVIGVSMERSPVMYESIQAGRPVVLREQPTLADSLLGGIGVNNEYTFDIARRYADDLLLVSEEEIADAMVFMMDHHRMIVEGAAAVGVAALLQGKVKCSGKKVGTIITGNNVDLPVVLEVIQKHQQQRR